LNVLTLKGALRQGQVVIGTWVFEFNTPGIARLLSSTGVDFVVYDMEHSGFGIESIRNLIGPSHPLNLAALVRPPAAQYHLIAPVLDVGASGIIAPMVETSEDAARVVQSCRYFPEGRRGAAFSIAHDDFRPGDAESKRKASNEAVLCGVLIETAKGVENVEEILSVPGIDLVWVGHLDLSLTMGIAGQFEHPRFLAAFDQILKACASHQIPAGIMVNDPQQGIERVRQGFRCLGYWGDLWLLQRALSEGVQAIRLGLSRGQTKDTQGG
jgi:2-dehydro-3-deoxyglucarate aldolase/4-hydroxy-2-oxoheptanedioate aldolase